MEASALAIPEMKQGPGLCVCGCGQPTTLAAQSITKRGCVKGAPNRFLRGHSGSAKNRALADRFWEKVEKGVGDDACWLFTGSTVKGYGSFGIGSRSRLAHRVAYVLHYGPLPRGVAVRHRCHVRRCVRWSHLLSGSTRDNNLDNIERQAHAFGSRQGSAKLSDDLVRSIRERYAEGQTGSELAREYGVSPTVIYLAVQRRTWRHVA